MEGVVRMPSAFSITLGVLPSMTATHELVVPRSMPMTLAILYFLSVRQVGRATWRPKESRAGDAAAKPPASDPLITRDTSQTCYVLAHIGGPNWPARQPFTNVGGVFDGPSQALLTALQKYRGGKPAELSPAPRTTILAIGENGP